MDSLYSNENDFSLYEEIEMPTYDNVNSVDMSSISTVTQENNFYMEPVDLALPTKAGTDLFPEDDHHI